MLIRRLISFAFIISAVLSLSSGAFAFPGEDTPAPPVIPEKCSQPTEFISDGSYYTWLKLENVLTFEFSADVAYVYIIWKEPPASDYTVTADGKSAETSEGAYLHELIGVDSARSITIEAEGDSICEISFFGGGILPSEVQRWEKPLEKCDILMTTAHADDEILMFGGTLPYYAGELDLAVQLAIFTNHTAEYPRNHELLDAIWYCGVEAYPITYGFPDIQCWSLNAAKNNYGEEKALECAVQTIRRCKPSVALTHDTNGEYGHGTHMLVSVITEKAAEYAADKEYHAESADEYGVWNISKLYLHLGENPLTMDWEKPLAYFGGMTAFEAAEKAYTFHKSQQKWGYTVNYGEYWNCAAFTLALTKVGEDTADNPDFMENIAPVTEEKPPQTEVTTAQTTTSAETSAEVTTEKNVTTTTAATSSVPEPADQPEHNIFVFIFIFAGAFAVLLALTAGINIVRGKMRK